MKEQKIKWEEIHLTAVNVIRGHKMIKTYQDSKTLLSIIDMYLLKNQLLLEIYVTLILLIRKIIKLRDKVF